jgi:hypothetical protein
MVFNIEKAAARRLLGALEDGKLEAPDTFQLVEEADPTLVYFVFAWLRAAARSACAIWLAGPTRHDTTPGSHAGSSSGRVDRGEAPLAQPHSPTLVRDKPRWEVLETVHLAMIFIHKVPDVARPGSQDRRVAGE